MRGPLDPVPDRATPAPTEELFRDLIVSGRARARRPVSFAASAALHVVLVGGAILGAILWPQPLPEHADYVRALLYDPPPPPPPPPLLGSDLALRAARAKAQPRPPEPPPDRAPLLVAPDLTPPSPPPAAEVPDGAGADQPGSPTGSEFGDALGMEGGVLGGEVGGVPGGVLGGVLGGTGHNLEPVRQPDRPARLLRQVRPRYPEEAFNKKVQGTVMVEIVIDAEGRVASARVVGPLPGLDAAALEAVRQWVFAPAMHRGKPVASIGLAPITFRIL